MSEVETPAHLKNDNRFSELMKKVTKFGEESSLGRDSLPKLAHAVVAAAADGVLDLETKDKSGNDCAAQIYDKYLTAESKKAIHEHSEGGKKANVSKLRQLITVGCSTTVDAVDLFQRAFKAREAMQADDNKVKPAYPFYIDVARAQIGEPKSALSDRQLERLACKDAPKEKTVEGELKRALKILEDLVTGEGKVDQDKSELTEAAFNAVKERLAIFATMALRRKLEQDAAKLGIKLA
jgi:hypothetical protein